MTEERITRKDIEEVKRQHILKNMLYTPQEVAIILSMSVRTVFELLETGRLTRAKHGNRTTRITAESVEQYRVKIIEIEA